MQDTPSPLPNSYWVEPGSILAGEYPGGRDEEETIGRLKRLLDAGIDCFVDLTEPAECDPYEHLLPGPYSKPPVLYLRLPIPDHGLPQSGEHMQEILDELDAALAEGRRIYLHCRAGIGRTNLVAGCWYASSAMDGNAALIRLNERWQGSARSQAWQTVPETDAQHDFVRDWQARRSDSVATIAPAEDAMPAAELRDRVRGMLLGLAAAEALGHEANKLPAGAWADKTAMSLCLAESYLARGAHDAADQVQRYQSWQRTGRWSATGVSAGASAATQRALATAQWTGNPYAGSHDPAAASAEPLARIGPAVAWHSGDARAAIEASVQATRVTHQAPLTLDAVRYFAALLAAAIAGADKAAILAPMVGPPGFWDTTLLKPRVRDVAEGSWRRRRRRSLVHGSQAAASALESALHAFDAGRDLRDCIESSAEHSAATVVAIVGLLAGAHYGAYAMPAAWRSGLARRAEIEALADALYERAERNAGRS